MPSIRSEAKGEDLLDEDLVTFAKINTKYMSYCIAKPSSVLSKFIKHYWAIENCIPTGDEHIQRVVPNGLPELIFYLGDKPKSTAKNKNIFENSILTGQINEYYDISITGKLSLFSIMFQPSGLAAFFNIPVIELLNQTVPLNYFLKDTVNEIENKLYREPTFAGRVRIAEQFLMKRLQQASKKYQLNRIEETIGIINKRRGLVNINELASIACLSRKQYERIFIELIGTSPKQFLKVVRFQNAIHEKIKNRDSNLTFLTYQCGYYDQSHMTNDFVQLSGLTPKQFFNECEPYSDYFN